MWLLVAILASTDVTSAAEREKTLLEYVAERDDLSPATRGDIDRWIRRVFGGIALTDGEDEGITAAKSVLAGGIFFGATAEQMVRGAYAAYHDVARWVPPPVAINYQLLSLQGTPPRYSAREMAYDFERHFDPEFAPELILWWESALRAKALPDSEAREIREALTQTRRRLQAITPQHTPQQRQPQVSAPSGFGERLLKTIRSWLGTPYRFGGTDRSGVDCSAFVREVVRRTLGASLPRSTRAQARTGVRVERDALEAGDLVFFDTLDLGRITHVGIYVGRGAFAHASSSRGVVQDTLMKRYYQRAYRTARRLTRPATDPGNSEKF